jgi:hypothetical protein
VETLKETGDSKKALAEAKKGVESTEKLEAKLGRSSYLDDQRREACRIRELMGY